MKITLVLKSPTASAGNVRGVGLIPGSVLWSKTKPSPVFLENPMGRRRAAVSRSAQKSQTALTTLRTPF